jgi:hypothetical protein
MVGQKSYCFGNVEEGRESRGELERNQKRVEREGPFVRLVGHERSAGRMYEVWEATPCVGLVW